MKKILLLLLLCPLFMFAEKKGTANPCDSLNQALSYKIGLSTQDVLARCESVFQIVISQKGDILKSVRLTDSTILVNGVFTLRKTSGYKVSLYYGRYIVPSHSDGQVSFKLLMTCTNSKLVMTFADITHINCRNALGTLCLEPIKKDETILKGVTVEFLHKVEDFVEFLRLSLNS